MEKKKTVNVRHENPLGYKKISSLLAGFAIPSIIAMLVSSLYNVVDQIFIGQNVGYLGNAATNVAFPLTTICMAITLTIAIGTAAQYSLFLGQKDEEKAAATVGSGICLMLLFGFVYAVLISVFHEPLLRAFGATDNVFPYAVEYTRITAIGMPFIVIMNGMSSIARADGSPMYSMTAMVIGAIVNTVLDYFFVVVFGMGVGGAAWATVIGQVVSAVFGLIYLKKLKRIVLKKRHFSINLHQTGRTCLMGMSNGLTQLAITVLQIVINRSLVYYGGLSVYGEDIPLAASGIVMKINAIVLAVIIGIVQGMQPIVGFNYGAKKYDRVKEVYKLAVISELTITIIGEAIFQLFPQQVLSIFGSGENEQLYFDFAVMFMRIFLCLLPLTGIQMISSNFFAAIGKPIKGAMLSLTRQIFFLIPLILILPLFFGIEGIIYASPAADVISFITVMIFIVMEMKNMTQKQLSPA